MSDRKTVLIVGAGLSGLVCGMRLSKAGFDVQIVEELTYAGGLLASSRIGKEYLELLPHHLRKTDKALLSLAKEEGLNVEWFDSLWYGRASRRKVGYFTGGFASLINSLIQDITDNGGRISYSTTVSEIAECTDGSGFKYATSCVLNDSGSLVIKSDYVIFTGSCRSFVNCSHGLPIPINFRDQLMNISYKASISIMMVLKRCPSEVYFQRLDSTTPFNRIVNHSNVFGIRSYGGNIVYLVGTCSISDSLWVASDEEIMDKYFSAFHKMYPVIKKSDIKSWRLTKNRYSVSERYPDQPLFTPAENMYICASGLTKYATAETPENRMDAIVALAGVICRQIIKTASEEHAEDNASVVTPIAEGMII